MRQTGPTVLLAAALGVAPAAPADEQTIALVVTDEQGAFVPDLRRDEVRVLENGDGRQLVDFALDERPLSLALVLDSSDSATHLYRLRYRSLPAKEGRRVEVRIARTGVRWHVAVDAP